MVQTIRAKIHKAVDLAEAGDLYFTAPVGGHSTYWEDYKVDKPKYVEALKHSLALPNFVIAPDLLALVSEHDFNSSLADLQRAGALRLPYPGGMVIEVPGEKHHVIGLLEETVVEGRVGLGGVVVRIYEDQEGTYLVSSLLCSALNFEKRDDEVWLGIRAWVPPWLDPAEPKLRNKDDIQLDTAFRKDTADLLRLVNCAAVLLGTSGIKREVIETQRLNRARLKSNKPPIPRHTYVSIGHVYRRAEGEEKDAYIPRRSPRPHWRRGFTKGVRYGPGLVNIRQQYIPPRLIAFKPEMGDEPPPPKYHVKF